jgi:hypothetical protein
MSSNLLFLGTIAGVALFCIIVFIARHERDAVLGKALRKAAGSESAARMAIESANLERLLRQKYDGETDKTMSRGFRALERLPHNVVRLAPRVTSRGKPLHFEPPGAA